MARLRRDVVPLVASDRAAAAIGLLDRIGVVGEQVFRHGNLVAEQVLVRDARVSGVIGWDESRVCDPALDLAWPLLGTPTAFAEAFADAYGLGPEAAARARDRWALLPWFAVHRDVVLGRDAVLRADLARLTEALMTWARSGAD